MKVTIIFLTFFITIDNAFAGKYEQSPDVKEDAPQRRIVSSRGHKPLLGEEEKSNLVEKFQKMSLE